MKPKWKVIISVILFLVILVLAIILYLLQTDWINMQGWESGYDKDTVYLNGIEALEFNCSVDTRIQYSYYVESGEVELKITKDVEGQNVVKSLKIAESCGGTMTFENDIPETYYVFETAVAGSVISTECWIEEKLTKWEQYRRNKESEKAFYDMQSQ